MPDMPVGVLPDMPGVCVVGMSSVAGMTGVCCGDTSPASHDTVPSPITSCPAAHHVIPVAPSRHSRGPITPYPRPHSSFPRRRESPGPITSCPPAPLVMSRGPIRHSRGPIRHSRGPIRHSRGPIRHSRVGGNPASDDAFMGIPWPPQDYLMYSQNGSRRARPDSRLRGNDGGVAPDMTGCVASDMPEVGRRE